MRKNIYFLMWALPLLLLSLLTKAQAQFTTFQGASMVIGQPDFNTIDVVVDQTHVPHASASAISAKGHFAVACSNEGRIMIWNTIPTNSLQPADVVVGKPDFVSAAPGVSQTLMNSSMGVAFSPDGEKLIASDSGNHRVLIWNTIPTVNGQAADIVLGQTDFNTGTTDGNPSATKFEYPTGIFVAPNGQMFVCDTLNNRVLLYNDIPEASNTPADIVIGQNNMTQDSNANGVKFVNHPEYVAVSPDGRLIIGDRDNFRATIFNTIPTADGASADIAIGFGGFPGDGDPGCDDVRFQSPTGVTVSPKGLLAIGDTENNRVLIYNQVPDTNFPSANVVLGQPDFVSNTPFNTGTNAQSMVRPFGINFDLNGRLFVNGPDMNRVMVFGDLPTNKAELAVDISFNLATQGIGGLVQMLVTVNNNGDSTADNVVVFTAPPVGLVTNGAPIVSTGTYNIASGFWSIPSLASGQAATLTIPLRVDANAQVDNTLTAYASITASDALDPIMTNNADRAEIVIGGVIIPVGTGIYGDLNNDGRPDLLWQRKLKLDGSKQTVVAGYLANGQGGFSSSEEVLASNTKKFSVVSIGDYNRDGFSDLFWQGKVKVAGSRKKMNMIQVSLGSLSNGFASPTAIATNTAKFKLATSRDVNGDGIEDLLWHGKIKVEGTRKKQRGVQAYFGDANGGYPTNAFIATNTLKRVLVTAYDFNADLRNDLIFEEKVKEGRKRVSQLSVYENQGNAVFDGKKEPGKPYKVTAPEPKLKFAAAGFFNNDGVIDVIWQRNKRKTRSAIAGYLDDSGKVIDSPEVATNKKPWNIAGPK